MNKMTRESILQMGRGAFAGRGGRGQHGGALCDHIVDICEEAEWNVTVC